MYFFTFCFVTFYFNYGVAFGPCYHSNLFVPLLIVLQKLILLVAQIGFSLLSVTQYKYIVPHPKVRSSKTIPKFQVANKERQTGNLRYNKKSCEAADI